MNEAANAPTKRMSIVWVGFHMEGLPALAEVLARGYDVVGVLTLTGQVAEKRSGAIDYAPICREYDVPLHRISNINDQNSVETLRTLAPDLLLVVGWSQILGDEVLDIAPMGVIGAHASLLPENRGRAPVNWALIRGDERGGNTLFWLDSDIDTGRIIDQRTFVILPTDTCRSVYEKVADSNRSMILSALARLRDGDLVSRPQPETDDDPLPGRKPDDGRIDWTRNAVKVYDLVRAVTRPYPGAFAYLEGRRWRIWTCACLPVRQRIGEPGEVLGSVWSPEEDGCGQLVACGTGGVILQRIEDDRGRTRTGIRLAREEWEGKVWT